MGKLRAHLLSLAVAFLALEAIGIAGAQGAFALKAAFIDTASACTCAHGPQSECPMHKQKPPTGSKFCSGCPTNADLLLTSIFSLNGLIDDREQAIEPADSFAPVLDHTSTTLSRSSDPLSPPPRN